MESLRTPDEQFADLPDWPYEPHYADVTADGHTLRMAFVDEGPADARPVLLLHGEPSWSYLYRDMIPPLLDAGLRVIAPDLIGFGRSDKPVERTDYTYARHMAWLTDLVVNHLDLRDAILFGQDWGGLLGLRLAAEQEDRFAAIVASNTFLPTGDTDPGDAFRAWRDFSQSVPEFPVGNIINGGSARDLTPEEIAAFDAPFPSEEYKAGARQFPTLVPASTDDPARPANLAAWEVLSRWEKPFVCAFGDSDPITKGADKALISRIPGTNGQPHETIVGAAHFCQHDQGAALAEVIVGVASRL